MRFDIQTVFMPSTGVDIIFDLNCLTPYSRSSIIYDADYAKQTITLAQPLTPISANTRFKELHISTIVQGKNRKIRVGLPCKKFKEIPRYQLANKKMVAAVLMMYDPPAEEINIRSSFRLPIGSRYVIKAKMFYQNLEFYSPKNFTIRDISFSGIGLLIPKKKKNDPNPLGEIEKNEELSLAIALMDSEQKNPLATLPLKSQVARVNPDYSVTHTLVGLKIIKLKRDDETILNKFIHDAQIDELKKLSRRNL